VVEDTPKLGQAIFSVAQIYATESSFSDIHVSLTAIFSGITPSESVKVRHSPLASENLTMTWKRCKIGDKSVMLGLSLGLGLGLGPRPQNVGLGLGLGGCGLGLEALALTTS